MSIEYLDIVDNQNRVIGNASLPEIYEQNLNHRIIHIIIKSQNGDILMQQRIQDEDGSIALSSSLGGHVSTGETYSLTALRELFEEYQINSSKPIFLSHKGDLIFPCSGNAKKYINVFETTLKDDIKLTTNEAVDAVFISRAEVQDLASNEPSRFHPELRLILENLYGIRFTEKLSSSRESIPLYQKDFNEIPIQVMDRETLNYLVSHLTSESKNIKEIFPQFSPLKVEEILKYVPESKWIDSKHLNSIHGLNHLTRVIIYALILSQLEGLSGQETKNIAIAAGIHDLGRQDDRRDPDHGIRSAEWMSNNIDIFEQRGLVLSDKDIQTIKALCTYHEYFYKEVPEVIMKHYGISLDIIMHADLLDRFRLPKLTWWPKSEFIRLESAQKLLSCAGRFTLKSEEYALDESQYKPKSVIRAAVEMNIVSAPNPVISKTKLGNYELESDIHQYTLWQQTREILNRLDRLRYGHVLSMSNVEGYPTLPLSKNQFGAALNPEINPLMSLFENDPISKSIDPVEVAWQYHLVNETPNGHLFKHNRLFDQINKGDGLTLIHITPNLDQIMNGNKTLYASGGCLGASVYTVPLRTDGRIHNLSKFILNDQIPSNPKFNKLDVLAITLDPESCNGANMEENWLDYLRFGSLHSEVFLGLVQNGSILKQDIDVIEREIQQELLGVDSFLKLCVDYNLEAVDEVNFEELFRIAIETMPELGNPYFEVILEYIALYQDDTETEKLAAEGELNTWNYFRMIFDLVPTLYSGFHLQKFKPTLGQLADYLTQASIKGRIFRHFSRDHFFSFMKWRLAQYIRRRMLGNQQVPSATLSLDGLISANPSILGHMLHRQMRNNPNLATQYYLYESTRARRIWEYWNQKHILTPMNALLPKGEVGINPTYPGIKYKIHRCYVDENDMVYPEEKLDITIANKLVLQDKSVLRGKTE
ncbi:hypothetical protein A2313_00905 [Candidatus Roizmanbacteria bacterium RIFOXYB2_FULL_41_10]|uniref:Nudix hydrolase domain-containing protein n=1 Tax=Candidatus Roizmanbacteria bacterium RIFOXYA1_FULL_41_12 TaxID=1802082 RepID=A0A1F7KFB8_9BACT|nr:MAG: hypothetical protein A2262_03720 [Candidatus Roizmanbacteria bacterium RIFOXYA2_FULL_41_8]OGK66552.1 MAG: hypothetical protein A2209_00960 [Candidatus Roizmanbacteria bacterium RIFOXYA1_FULL_41_12]OGK67252.1 MAG: hypothetical protein A2377_01400 [Candidatus Roizmanbacteria bacterium RIFOXYB1_FULL_41_27]OGK69324.1 MAG: hypothetical protein A2313_00905 [Candidatus Roizmanbacteria bacterium RIFOXYB2_FULL_41_10]OGK71782.1 MAG: hypothetical protein A2403_00270 [Candidatus Roizmanbacteria bac